MLVREIVDLLLHEEQETAVEIELIASPSDRGGKHNTTYKITGVVTTHRGVVRIAGLAIAGTHSSKSQPG